MNVTKFIPSLLLTATALFAGSIIDYCLGFWTRCLTAFSASS